MGDNMDITSYFVHVKSTKQMVVMNSATSGASQAYQISTAKEMNNLKENEQVKKIMENVG